MKKVIAIVATLAIGLLLAQAALAEQGHGKGQGRQRGEGKGQRRPPVVFGAITAISGSTWTIRPQLPPHLRERREQRGAELPQLPESVTVSVGEATKYYLDGAVTSASAFKTGSEVVIKLARPTGESSRTAEIVADPETARELIMDKLRQGREGRGQAGQRVEGRGQGPGAEGRRGPRPMFGTITALSADSLTIKPEVPDFLKARLPEGGMKLDKVLPESITVALDSETRFLVGEQPQNTNPFKVGDKVAILGAGPRGESSARAVSDYASVKQRMQQRMEKRQGKQGKGKAKGQ